MEHNLDDSLNMAVDYGHSEEVETQADIGLDSSGHEAMSMEFEQIEGQPPLMDTEYEEIIVSDYIVDNNQYSMLGVQGGQMAASVTEQIVPSQSQVQPKETSTPAPLRQIAIAPKPPQQSMLLQKAPKQIQVSKQYAIAPKPVTVMSNKMVSLVKKVSLAGAMQANAKGKPVLAQIGKQLVMVPASGPQKLKMMTTPTVRLIGNDQAKLIAAGTGGPKQLTKVIVQGTKVKSQSNSDPSSQSAVLTKVVSGAGTTAPTRYVTMHQKTVPITIGDKKIILSSSPVKQGAAKQQVLSLKSPTKILPAIQTTQGAPLKKVVINANQVQNVVMKSQPKTISVNKGAQQGQKTQLHRIEVPGKGVQYIRLVTNSSPGSTKPTTKVTTSTAATQKTYVLTDAKGNVFQMCGELGSAAGQPPPLVVSTAGNNNNKPTSKPPQKLVRIAPVTSKTGQAFMQQKQARSAQSLLTPQSQPRTTPQPVATSIEDMPDPADLVSDTQAYHEEIQQPMDSKTALHALIADAVRDGPFSPSHEPQQGERAGGSPSPPPTSHPLIVVPSFLKHDPDSYLTQDEMDSMGGAGGMGAAMNVEVELEPYSPRAGSPAISDTELIQTQFGLRPRKACNCTKSQCLKLYCDCFANGEFCNRCNCHNCHNNLDNEELRQKAIRGCLDRNPFAFRPKIGKTKAVGPEAIRRHNKGCNCKRSGCLKNYCECYEAKIACSSMCKCVGCRNVEDSMVSAARRRDGRDGLGLRRAAVGPRMALAPLKEPCSFMTMEVIEAVCQCLVAAGAEGGRAGEGAVGTVGGTVGIVGTDAEPRTAPAPESDPVRSVLDEFARCLQDIISAAHHTAPASATAPASLLEART